MKLYYYASLNFFEKVAYNRIYRQFEQGKSFPHFQQQGFQKELGCLTANNLVPSENPGYKLISAKLVLERTSFRIFPPKRKPLWTPTGHWI